jgi:hypothetical protein
LPTRDLLFSSPQSLCLLLHVVVPSEALFADEGPAVLFASVPCLLLHVVIPSEALFADEGPAVRVACPFLFPFSSFLRCHPEQGHFPADEGPVVHFTFSFAVRLACFCPFSFFFFTLSSRARRFLPTRDLLFASHRLSLCLALGFFGSYYVARNGEVCSPNSSHVGFVRSISAIFLARRQPLISFSRRIAALMSAKTS